jgi:hypothetical protein
MDDISLSIGKKNIGERDLRRVESDSSLLKFQNEEMDSTMESYRAIKKSKR